MRGVRIGQSVQLRTSYNVGDSANLISRDSAMYDNASSLKPGDAVIVSGSSVPSAKGCLFDSPDPDASDDVEVLFQFTKLKTANG